MEIKSRSLEETWIFLASLNNELVAAEAKIKFLMHYQEGLNN